MLNVFRSLDRQIESGSMKLVDEKKALQEISNLRRSRKTLEASGSVDDAIAADRARIDDLRKLLDDPESRKVSDKFDVLKKEMEGLREEGNKAYEERGKLFDERNALSAQMVSFGRAKWGIEADCGVRMNCMARNENRLKNIEKIMTSEDLILRLD